MQGERSHDDEKIEKLQRTMYSRAPQERLRERPRRELMDERKLVGDDWKRTEPTLSSSRVAPFGIGVMRVAMTWLIVAAVAFFVGAGGFFLYFFTIGGGASATSPGNIDIAITGPLYVSSGAPAQFQIVVTNRNRTTLQLADLLVKYPKGTRSPSDFLTDLPNQRIPLGEIEPGGRRQGTVSAVFAGEEGKSEKVDVELEYRLANASSIFVAQSDYQFTFSSSPLSITVDALDEVISGQPLQMTVTVASNADAPVKDVLLSTGIPFGYAFSSAEPKPLKKESPLMWSLGDIGPGMKKTIVLRGVLSGEMGDERVFKLSAGTRKSKTDAAITSLLAEHVHTVLVSRPFLDLAVSVTRGEGVGEAVTPGEMVPVTVEWANNLDTVLTDVVVVARLSGIDIDGSAVRTPEGFYRSSDRSVLWDKTTNPKLASVAAGTRGTLTFLFRAPANEELEKVLDPKLTVTVHAAGRRVSESGVPETLQSTAGKTIRIASNVQLFAQGLYYANPFGSTGPLPPKAGTETTYALVLSVTNTTGKITGGVVRAVLPPYVRWVGIYSPSNEKIEFNQNDSTITWRVGDIAPGTGIGTALPRQVAIAVGFTPSTSQIGQQPALVRGLTLTGLDEQGAAITKQANDITTSLQGDPGFKASDAPVVRE